MRRWSRCSTPTAVSCPSAFLLSLSPLSAGSTRRTFFFQKTVHQYVFEETFEGKLLHETINLTHENPKYLPGVNIGDNIVATPNVREAVKDAHVLVFVMPHQFLKSICMEIQGHVLPGAKAISLVKGFDCEGNQINLMSEFIKKTLGIECSSLSGANVAEGVANEQFSEVNHDNRHRRTISMPEP